MNLMPCLITIRQMTLHFSYWIVDTICMCTQHTVSFLNCRGTGSSLCFNCDLFKVKMQKLALEFQRGLGIAMLPMSLVETFFKVPSLTCILALLILSIGVTTNKFLSHNN